jgi:hypothetical protein
MSRLSGSATVSTKNKWRLRLIFRILFLLVLLVPIVAAAGDEDKTAVPFFVPTPEGWRTETIPFPLEFAPELNYEGLEELRFAPGMFTADSNDFWTYAFVWWIAGDTTINPDSLATDLEIYFSGLADAVAKEREIDASGATYDVQLAAPDSTSSWAVGHVADYMGTARVFDPFVTGEMLSLNVRVKEISCPGQSRLAVIFELSPQPYTHPVWIGLAGIRDGFRCRK